MRLFVDDIRSCPEGFVVARNYDEAVRLICNNRIHILSLDHDLGEEKSGYDIAKMIVEMGLDDPLIWPDKIYIHTDNPVGRSNILQLLSHYAPMSTSVKHYKYK